MAASTLTATSSSTSCDLPSTATHGLRSTGSDTGSGFSWTNSKDIGRDSTAGQGTTAQDQGGKWKPALCVILVELINTGLVLLGKVALDSGMFVFSWLCYRSILGAVFLLLFALFLESGKWKELDKTSLGWLFTNAFFGYTLPTTLYYYGLRDTPASYAMIFSCLTPLFTFVISLLLGMENMHLKSKDGSAKVTGALVCFGGAILTSLYKGKELHLWSTIIRGIPKYSNVVVGGHHLRGTFLLLGDCISYAFWYPIQVKVLKVYPWKHWSLVFTCAFGCLQTYAIGIFFRRDKLAWEIRWNIQLITIIYSASLGTSAKYWLYLYAVEKRGPVFPTMFSGLSTVFTVILGTLLLGENLTIGSLSGIALILVGLYMYLYGKAEEMRVKTISGSTNDTLKVQPASDSKSEDMASGP